MLYRLIAYQSIMKLFVALSLILPVTFLGSSCSMIGLQESSPISNDSQCDQQGSAPERRDYQPISLDQIATNESPQQKTLIGDDPKTMVLERFGLSSIQASQNQQITVICPESNQVIVLLTQTGLLDDSVAGIRYYIEFVPVDNKWQIRWAGKQQKCYRGHTDWSPERCI